MVTALPADAPSTLYGIAAVELVAHILHIIYRSVADGNHYKGLMNASEYKAKRQEVMIDPEVARRERHAAAIEMVHAARKSDGIAKEKDLQERQKREEVKRERLKQELEEEANDANYLTDVGQPKPHKKKKKVPMLSFDVEEFS